MSVTGVKGQLSTKIVISFAFMIMTYRHVLSVINTSGKGQSMKTTRR